MQRVLMGESILPEKTRTNEMKGSRMKSTLLAVGLCGLAFTGQVNAATFQNGSFEDGTSPPTTSYQHLYSGATDITGWVVTSGLIDWAGRPYNPKDGSLSVELSTGSSIVQTFDTVPGQSYIVTFSLRPWVAVTTPVNVDVTLGGSTYQALISSGADVKWYDYSATLTASSLSSMLTFTSRYGDPFLDAVSVAAVPEPSTFIAGTLALLPFGLSMLRKVRR